MPIYRTVYHVPPFRQWILTPCVRVSMIFLQPWSSRFGKFTTVYTKHIDSILLRTACKIHRHFDSYNLDKRGYFWYADIVFEEFFPGGVASIGLRSLATVVIINMAECQRIPKRNLWHWLKNEREQLNPVSVPFTQFIARHWSLEPVDIQ